MSDSRARLVSIIQTDKDKIILKGKKIEFVVFPKITNS